MFGPGIHSDERRGGVRGVGEATRQRLDVLSSKVLYDLPVDVLYSLLAQIKDGVKDQYPKETVIKLAADSTIPIKHIIEVMDSIRFRLEKDSYAKDAEFKDATVKYEEVDGKRKPVLLWPDVIFAKAQ